MSKEIFKVGDKVYHIEYGWGVVKDNKCDHVSNFPIVVEFKEHNLIVFSNDGKEIIGSKQPTLSFTEYTLQGFTQERPIELPKVGELCLVRDKDHHPWIVKEFVDYKPKCEFPYVTEYEVPYAQMKRIKILD